MKASYQLALPIAGRSSDEWMTPIDLFTSLNERFAFTIDVASNGDNAKCDRHHTPTTDGLAAPWANERVWCNPPYSNIRPWVAKAHSETSDACPLAVMLLPANRTGQPWWTDLVEPFRDRGQGLTVEFLPGRVHFVRPGQDPNDEGERPTFAACLLIWQAM